MLAALASGDGTTPANWASTKRAASTRTKRRIVRNRCMDALDFSPYPSRLVTKSGGIVPNRQSAREASPIGFRSNRHGVASRLKGLSGYAVLTEINVNTTPEPNILEILERDTSMRVFAMSIVALIVIAVLGRYLLDKISPQTADQAFSSSTYVRFPHQEAGHNLVGKDWSSAKEH